MTSNDVTFEDVRLMNGDCLERMKEIADGSVDAIICDPPFGTVRVLVWTVGEGLKRIGTRP